MVYWSAAKTDKVVLLSVTVSFLKILMLDLAIDINNYTMFLGYLENSYQCLF